ncbi:MAG: hypothetical protein AB7D33_14100 [Sphingobium sp.]
MRTVHYKPRSACVACPQQQSCCVIPTAAGRTHGGGGHVGGDTPRYAAGSLVARVRLCDKDRVTSGPA